MNGCSGPGFCLRSRASWPQPSTCRKIKRSCLISCRRVACHCSFLLVPLPFYALSVAYGGVPIFIPAWWPFTHYNVRYGLQLLPAFAAALAILVYLPCAVRSVGSRDCASRACWSSSRWSSLSYASSLARRRRFRLKEAQVNMRTRNQLEAQLATWLEKLPSELHTAHVPRATTSAPCSRPAFRSSTSSTKAITAPGGSRHDPEGLWEHALADPAHYADYVVAFEGDPVWQAVHDRHLPELVEIHVTGQARAILYRAR